VLLSSHLNTVVIWNNFFNTDLVAESQEVPFVFLCDGMWSRCSGEFSDKCIIEVVIEKVLLEVMSIWELYYTVIFHK